MLRTVLIHHKLDFLVSVRLLIMVWCLVNVRQRTASCWSLGNGERPSFYLGTVWCDGMFSHNLRRCSTSIRLIFWVDTKNLFQTGIYQRDTVITLSMLHDENAISKHRQHTLPLLLLYLRLRQQIKPRPQINLVHSYKTSRENDRGGNMNVEVISKSWWAILSKNHEVVNQIAKKVDGYNWVPLHGTCKTTKHHHDQPRRETLI